MNTPIQGIPLTNDPLVIALSYLPKEELMNVVATNKQLRSAVLNSPALLRSYLPSVFSEIESRSNQLEVSATNRQYAFFRHVENCTKRFSGSGPKADPLIPTSSRKRLHLIKLAVADSKRRPTLLRSLRLAKLYVPVILEESRAKTKEVQRLNQQRKAIGYRAAEAAINGWKQGKNSSQPIRDWSFVTDYVSVLLADAIIFGRPGIPYIAGAAIQFLSPHETQDTGSLSASWSAVGIGKIVLGSILETRYSLFNSSDADWQHGTGVWMNFASCMINAQLIYNYAMSKQLHMIIPILTGSAALHTLLGWNHLRSRPHQSISLTHLLRTDLYKCSMAIGSGLALRYAFRRLLPGVQRIASVSALCARKVCEAVFCPRNIKLKRR